MHRASEAQQMFSEALLIFRDINQNSEAVAENLYCLAESNSDKGDIEEALQYGREGCKLRESIHGQQHPKTIDSYQQLARLLASRYNGYDGVITASVRNDISEAISLYECVFRFVKETEGEKYREKNKRSVLLNLIRTLIGLKLKIAPTQHKELARRLRETQWALQGSVVKQAILKLIHLTPIVYLEQIFQRLDSNDAYQQASDELTAVVQIAESPELVVEY
jgi:tetratricopeptide (TPR) repeat protein